MNDILKHALQYAARGLPVFPCGPDKRPLTPHGYKDASKDTRQITRWWTKWPNALIGMPTGKMSGISVIDLDNKGGKNGFKSLPGWKKKSNLIVLTMNKGAHLWFADPSGKIPSTTNKLGQGIDTRGNGGYVIVPPSKGYQWINGSDLSQLQPWPTEFSLEQRERSPKRFKNTEPADPERVRRALAVIPSDDYEQWYKAAGALYHEFGEKGFELFEEWSKRSAKYSWKTCEEKWKHAPDITDYTIGTIFLWANNIDIHWDDAQEEIPEGATTDDFIAYMPSHNYMYLPTRTSWPAASVNAKLPKQVVKNKKITASAWLDKNRAVEMMTWSPGDPQLIKDRLVLEGGWIDKKDVMLLNLYMPPVIKSGIAHKAKPWLDLVKKVYPAHAEHILNYFAQRVQCPGIKINHCLLLGGAPGIGKDTILEAVKMAVGPWNFSEVTPQTLLSRFNAHIKSVILRVSEARDMGDLNRYSFYEHTKTLMAAPPDALSCEEKHTKAYMVFNVTGVVITTNHKTDGIYLPEDDRRHYVAWSPITKDAFTEKYWQDFWQWYRAGGFEHVAAYLRQHNIKSFNPKAAPLQTDAFLDIVDANRAPEDSELLSVLNRIKRTKGFKIEEGIKLVVYEYLKQPDVTTIEEIINSVENNPKFKEWLEDRKNRRTIGHRMEECDYYPLRNPGRHNPDKKIKGSHLWGERATRRVIYGRKDLPMQRLMLAARLLARNFK